MASREAVSNQSRQTADPEPCTRLNLPRHVCHDRVSKVLVTLKGLGLIVQSPAETWR